MQTQEYIIRSTLIHSFRVLLSVWWNIEIWITPMLQRFLHTSAALSLPSTISLHSVTHGLCELSLSLIDWRKVCLVKHNVIGKLKITSFIPYLSLSCLSCASLSFSLFTYLLIIMTASSIQLSLKLVSEWEKPLFQCHL